jgi:zinc protease
MESDRMGWLLPALSIERFETQRAVVLNERRQNYENRPYGLASFAIHEAVFPADHPYHWPTIGHPADLAAATIDDVRAFFTRYYHPGNASLAIAGDIAAGEAFALAQEHFGEIPAGEPVPPVVAPVPRPRAARLVIEDRVELPRLYLAWPSPALFAPGDAELDLAADILGNGPTSRLYKRLVHDTRIAAELAAAQTSRELGGTFQIIATAAPGRTIAELEVAIFDEIGRFSASGPDEAELARGRAQSEAAFVYRLQTLGGFGGKADQLNAYNVYKRDPGYFASDLQRYLQATARDLQTSVSRWLDPRLAVALSVVPQGRRDLAPDAERAAIEVGS